MVSTKAGFTSFFFVSIRESLTVSFYIPSFSSISLGTTSSEFSLRPLLLLFALIFSSPFAFAESYRCDMLLSSTRTAYAYAPGLNFMQKLDLVRSQWDPKISSFSIAAATAALHLQESLTFKSMVRVAEINFLVEKHLSIPTTQALLKAFNEKKVDVSHLSASLMRDRIVELKSTLFTKSDWSEDLIKQLANIYLYFPPTTRTDFLADLAFIYWIQSHVSAMAKPLTPLQATRLLAAAKLAKWVIFSLPDRFERVRIQFMLSEAHQAEIAFLRSTEEALTILELLANSEHARMRVSPDAVLWIESHVLDHRGELLDSASARSLFLTATKAGWKIEDLPGILRRTIKEYGNQTDFALENPTQEALIVLALLADQKRPAP